MRFAKVPISKGAVLFLVSCVLVGGNIGANIANTQVTRAYKFSALNIAITLLMGGSALWECSSYSLRRRVVYQVSGKVI